MAKSAKKAAEQLEEDLQNFDLYDAVPMEGSWRRMRFLAYIYALEERVARDGRNYIFMEFVEWYGPRLAERYWRSALTA